MFNTEIIKEIVSLKLSFSEGVKRLSSIDVERYYTDLVSMKKIYYSKNGDTYIDHLFLKDKPPLANHFNEILLINTIREAQHGIIDYDNFLRKIISNGIASYTVYIEGKKVIYSSRNGDMHIEPFPYSE